MKIFQAILVSLFVCQVYSSTACKINSICSEETGVIRYSSNSNFYQQPYQFWKISTKMSTNVLLSFKNFEIRSATLVVAVKENGRKTVKHFYFEQRDNFEIVLENVDTVWLDLYQIQRSNTSFTIQYFSGCQVLKDGYLSFPPRFYNLQAPPTCFFVETPKMLGPSKRLYFSARNVFLQTGVKLAIYDIGSTSFIGDVFGEQDAAILVTDVPNQQNYVLVQLECLSETCDFKNSVFFLSYYAMSEQDIQCIEVQRQCSLHIDIIPPMLCKVHCPMFEQMLEREISLEENAPTVRSGEITEDDTAKSRSSDKTIQPGCVLPPPFCRECPLAPQFCQCAATKNLLEFCGPEKCQVGGGNSDCLWACVLTKLVVCPRIREIKAAKQNNSTSASIRLI